MNKKMSSERIALLMVLILLGTAMSASIVLVPVGIVLAGDKGTFGKEQTINLYNLTTWQGANMTTDDNDDNLNQTVTNVTDILNVWICNNYTYLFVRVDVNETFDPSVMNFTMQLYVEDAAKKQTGNDTLVYPNGNITKNDINATFLFTVWSTNQSFARHNFVGTQWTFNQTITNATTQGAFNWTQKSFVMMIHLSLLSSNGTVATGSNFKFEVYAGWTDGTSWYAADLLDYGKYTLTGSVIPEFPSLTLLFTLLLLTSFALAIARKSKRIR